MSHPNPTTDPTDEEREEDDILDDDSDEGELGGVCKTCLGTREIAVMGTVYPGEGHQALVDTQPCPDCCPPRDEDEYDSQE